MSLVASESKTERPEEGKQERGRSFAQIRLPEHSHRTLFPVSGTHDPSNRSGVGGVAALPALPNPPLSSASLPAPGTAPWGPCHPAGDPPEPPKTSGS